MVRDLRGMYAFVIWDQRRRRLIAARDPLGIKPLYYADNGRTLRTASQVKALLRGGGIESRREPAGEVGFLMWGYVPDPFTIHRGIRALPAGSMMVAEQGRTPTIRTFCDLSEELAAAAASNHMPATALAVRERIHAALVESVRYHLIADVPVGIFQSAGLDSSAMTALAAETDGARLSTITLGFDEYRGTHDDETSLAAMVAEQYATDHNTRWLGRSEFEAHFERVVAAMDQPSTDGVIPISSPMRRTRSDSRRRSRGSAATSCLAATTPFARSPRSPAPGAGFCRARSPARCGSGSPRYSGA